ncbi:LysM peptidoglycan-binding domain-containing protein [Rhodothermus profundi]|uniref:BON domain-containing protein n=1 Tax=Rhodothermus profundi TaxID=633813 RepID=A0A1M6TW79_9BACT|nr:LysM peptidoglycan-binding domain-containing protein [Rhodothermus profundi]SHK61144.1 BON domain-containing protein [Rhodothermus profundi]
MKGKQVCWIGLGLVWLAGCTASPKPSAVGEDLTSPATALETGEVAPDPLPELSAKTHAAGAPDSAAVARRLQDQALVTQVLLAVSNAPALRAHLPVVKAQDGVVTLQGSVPSEAHRQQMVQVVRRLSGVTEVIDRLIVEITSSPAGQYHTVQPGETLWDIARRYGLSVTQLRRMNALRTSTIQPGQRLRVR